MRPVDVQLRLFERDSGKTRALEGMRVVHKEVQGEWICLTADSESGGRLTFKVRASVFDEIAPPPTDLQPVNSELPTHPTQLARPA
jgi:hypothetical protein